MIHPIATRFRSVAVLLVAILFAVSVSGSEGPEGARLDSFPEGLTQRGVASYELDVEGSSASVDLMGPTKAAVGTVELSWDVEEGTLIELDRPEANLLMIVHPLEGKIQLIDLRTEATASGTWTDEGWQVDGPSQRLLELYADEIAIMSEVHDDVFFNHVQAGGIRDRLEKTRLDTGTPGEKANTPCPPICNGPTVRGSTLIALSRSACCAQARADANLKCWNSHCTGCCHFYSCDAFCAVGDYVCFPCGITGRACSGATNCNDCY